uniref:PCI domain-containing protein n=1 Tax=Timspurckia oligopyrenoides TaxID=708627 RepID=A0A6T6P515_9RHOD|mmetsp:Transcript_80/g.136  ORF Transcript_80/g.136 Transcript_80/m.136 type:complete len:387 (+) Transcript_80:165-1325(+)|eukprot:CAMPEP_0182444222 /NCGR_PEP_ID=MMETSP1172-20130603/2748_1 /TAXON_ID=708627 /ORGANISM="Timspurckia oligopyrenoides, Strain CCMP3278" /LENGTH=386 /DNA_ID=CAMNT_0024639737 /DNA_START=145 /DNA_END=1305 /DNA_ORIENTATION=+
MAEDFVPQDDVLRLAELRFRVGRESGDNERLKAELKQELESRLAVGWIDLACKELGWELSESELQKMKELQDQVDVKLKMFDDKIKDAEENLGESEVRDALQQKTEFLVQIGKHEMAVESCKKTMSATVGVGQRLDLVMMMIRMGLAEKNYEFTAKQLETAKDMVEKGGDWERRNRLRVYEATYLMAIRKLSESAALFQEALATFSASELYSYERFVQYTVLVCMPCVDRPTLKDKVSNAPEVLAVILELPLLRQFVESLVKCDYKTYMNALPDVLQDVSADYYLAVHVNYLGRELRVTAYLQFLASYLSVTLSAMSRAFGVSEEFLDSEMTRFIAAGRLNCKIDKVSGIIETTRPDARNSIYQATIKQGDLLLNRIQKLSRVIDI